MGVSAIALAFSKQALVYAVCAVVMPSSKNAWHTLVVPVRGKPIINILLINFSLISRVLLVIQRR